MRDLLISGIGCKRSPFVRHARQRRKNPVFEDNIYEKHQSQCAHHIYNCIEYFVRLDSFVSLVTNESIFIFNLSDFYSK